MKTTILKSIAAASMLATVCGGSLCWVELSKGNYLLFAGLILIASFGLVLACLIAEKLDLL